MLYEKIMSVSQALSCLAGQVSEEQWQLIKMAKGELMDAADMAEELEGAPLYAVRGLSRTQPPACLLAKDQDQTACRCKTNT